jgi:hypothetical protein
MLMSSKEIQKKNAEKKREGNRKERAHTTQIQD